MQSVAANNWRDPAWNGRLTLFVLSFCVLAASRWMLSSLSKREGKGT